MDRISVMAREAMLRDLPHDGTYIDASGDADCTVNLARYASEGYVYSFTIDGERGKNIKSALAEAEQYNARVVTADADKAREYVSCETDGAALNLTGGREYSVMEITSFIGVLYRMLKVGGRLLVLFDAEGRGECATDGMMDIIKRVDPKGHGLALLSSPNETGVPSALIIEKLCAQKRTAESNAY